MTVILLMLDIKFKSYDVWKRTGDNLVLFDDWSDDLKVIIED